MKKNKLNETLSAGGAEVSIIPIMAGEGPAKLDTASLPDVLPVLALRNVVLFPGTVFPVIIGREKSLKLIEDAQKNNAYILAAPQTDIAADDPTDFDSLSHYGTVAKIIRSFELPDGTVSAVLQGYGRACLSMITETEPYLSGKVFYLNDSTVDLEKDSVARILSETVKEKAASVLRGSGIMGSDINNALRSIEDFNFLVNFVATTTETDDPECFEKKLHMLEISDIKERAMELLSILDKQSQFAEIKQEINARVKTEIDQQQREYYLNNQLRTIQEELGMGEDDDVNKLREAASQKQWSKETAELFEKEIGKLERYNPTSPEYSIQYNYLQFMLDLPWEKKSEDNLDLAHAQEVLDADHYGLEKVKERIIEYLAVLKLKGDLKSPILCLYGPPGVGKTSLGKSIARAVGRQYVRISLGGMHDESEIRGHRKTYVGALPGRILNGISKAGTSNPVMVLDEIDKLSSDYKGDPSSALLEVLDPEQNTTFHDNYLDVDYDLSNVMFITTANSISGIQPALLDRMELINVTGYLAEEKLEIAKNYLVPKQLKEHGLEEGQVRFSEDTIKALIDTYTHESGVRGLEKQIAKVARVSARKVAMGEQLPETLKPGDLKEYLGLPTAFHDKQEGNEGVGIVTGLAWTSMGGEILFIESSVSPGKGNLTMTGNLGDVMKESATIGYQWIKAHTDVVGMDAETFAQKDIHVHVPEGATPKDGPSAGITMVTSMVSALSGKAPKPKVAMTGEMTLRGRVLPVGGIKEKILAAKRSGVDTIVICEDNRKDIEDINEKYVKGLTFVYVKTIDDVLNYVFSK